MKDYLHFYIGQYVDVLRKYPSGDSQVLKLILDAYTYMNIVDGSFKDSEVKLVLRPLSDMKADEFKEWERLLCEHEGNSLTSCYKTDAAQTAYLLEKGFDVFGLKEKGLAIYKTDVK
jgi:hypothetical protein